MSAKANPSAVNSTVALLSVFGNAIVLENAIVSHSRWYWWLLITVPLTIFLLIGFYRKQE